ncbi:TPA: hypothetical protein MC588_002738 [Citrobacter amalonaticus]|nr:hypothetical protein [Citrobacter amalonaticus]HCB3263912.1 hypothetical protein [Citrobacter amalonaticus]
MTIAAYRYSSSGYMDFQTAMSTRDAMNNGSDPDSVSRSKNQFSLSFNQGLLPGWVTFMSAHQCKTTGITTRVTTHSISWGIPITISC